MNLFAVAVAGGAKTRSQRGRHVVRGRRGDSVVLIIIGTSTKREQSSSLCLKANHFKHNKVTKQGYPKTRLPAWVDPSLPMSDTVMLTARTVFPPEVDISTVRLASRIVWPSETGHTITTHAAMEKEEFVVPCPPGEVGRPHDSGFALKAVLGWSNKKYTTV